MASRQNPATGKLMLGPSCGSKAALGGAIFGSSPRRHINAIRLSAKTLSPAPYVHFSFPGRVLTSCGQFLTSRRGLQSFRAQGSGTAANPAPGFHRGFDGRQLAGNHESESDADRQHQHISQSFRMNLLLLRIQSTIILRSARPYCQVP